MSQDGATLRAQRKYDSVTTAVRLATDAASVALLVVDGHHGSGFSVQGSSDLLSRLPQMLRRMADSVEHELNVDPL